MAERIFRGFLFLSRRIFSRIFSPDFFSSFLWEKVPRKILQENPRENPPKFIQQKSSDTFLQIAQGKNFCPKFALNFPRFFKVSPMFRALLPGKIKLSLRGVAVTTETATNAETAKTVKPSLSSLGTVFCRTSQRRARCSPEPPKPSRSPKPSWRLPPLNSTPSLFRHPERKRTPLKIHQNPCHFSMSNPQPKKIVANLFLRSWEQAR